MNYQFSTEEIAQMRRVVQLMDGNNLMTEEEVKQADADRDKVARETLATLKLIERHLASISSCVSGEAFRHSSGGNFIRVGEQNDSP
jgi:hypothetical protein